MNPTARRPSLPVRLAKGSLILAGVLVVLVLLRFLQVTRDRWPGYSLDLSIKPAPGIPQAPLRAGFGRRNINPDLARPGRPVWLAGFDQHRSATAIHDDLEVVAIVLDDGHARIGVAVIDAIGFFHDDVVAVRKRLPAELRLDYVAVCATHNHSTPDLMGLWGPDYLHSGVDPEYRRKVVAAAADALSDACGALRPARMAAHEIAVRPEGMVADTRPPEVFDPDLRILHFTEAAGGGTIGTLVGWANHPETPWAGNREITADYPGVVRRALEKGIAYDGHTRMEGLGGIHVVANGAVGGLMSTTPSVTVRDRFLDKDFKEPSHEKTRALGNELAARILDAVRGAATVTSTHVPIAVEARTIRLPLDNRGFLLAAMIGLFERGHTGFMRIRTEIALIRLGDVSLACVPGEIYPEQVNGGVVRAPGGDHDVEPVETPPLRELMPGRVKFVLGLANDEIGYIIPKSEWDTEPPFIFGRNSAPYGEINSLGPETAPLLHAAFGRLFEAAR